MPPPDLASADLTDGSRGDLSMILYVSRSTLPPDEATELVATLAAEAAASNQVRGISGSLIFTGEYFAQIIEGPGAALEALMVSLRIDSRHEDIVIVAEGPIAERRFAAWSMAYSGPALFVSGHIVRLLRNDRPPDRRPPETWLLEIMEEFSKIHVLASSARGSRGATT